MIPVKSNHIVVIKVRAMGDTLLATPAFRALRKANPEASITAVVSPLGATVLEENPHIDRIIVYDKKKRFVSVSMIQQLREPRFDLAIALHASFRTALLARMTGAKKRVVHNHSGTNYFGTIPILVKKESKSTIERDLDTMHALGLEDAGTQLDFVLKQEDRLCVDTFFKQNNLDVDKPFWVLAPSAGKLRKQWTPQAAATFLDAMVEKKQGPWIVLSDPHDNALAKTICQHATCKPALFEQEIKEVGYLMKLSQGVVTCDSGPKHIAVAVGARTLTLWTDEPEAEWHPYDLAQHALIRSSTGIVADISAEQVVEKSIEHFKL